MRLTRRSGSHFAGLVEAIVYQQLAGAAARAIHSRLVAALDGRVEPEALLALSDETLRAVGVSANKARSLRDLATMLLDGTVILSPRGLSRQSDEEVVTRLSSVRGIGPWTAQMFLIFRLRRLDVWPTGDCPPGIRPRVERADADCAGARAARRPLSPVPHGRRLVLLAGCRALQRRRRERSDPIGAGRRQPPLAHREEPRGRVGDVHLYGRKAEHLHLGTPVGD